MSPRRLRPPRTTEARRQAVEAGEPGTFVDGLRLSVGTLTALPIAAPASMQAPAPGIAMTLAPAVGVIPGVAAWIVAAACGLAELNALVAAAAAIGALALTTRALHLDGLADTADGLAASYDRERALDVMRRGNTGPAGMSTLAIVLILQVAALAQVLSRFGWGAGASTEDTVRAASVVLLVAIAARVAVPLACVRGVRAARPEGLGATVAGSVAPPVLAAVVVVSALACSLLGLLSDQSWWAGLVAVLLVVVASGAVLWRAVRRFGGITGDVIGACVETGTVAALLVLAAA